MFELRVNGQRVWSSKRQVTRLSVQSGRGEIGASGIGPDDGVIDVFIEEVAPAGPARLDQVEESQRQAVAATPSGLETGTAGYTPAKGANKEVQGVNLDPDAPAGGPDVGDEPSLVRNRPETSPTGVAYNEDGTVGETSSTSEEESSEEENKDINFNLSTSS